MKNNYKTVPIYGWFNAYPIFSLCILVAIELCVGYMALYSINNTVYYLAAITVQFLLLLLATLYVSVRILQYREYRGDSISDDTEIHKELAQIRLELQTSILSLLQNLRDYRKREEGSDNYYETIMESLVQLARNNEPIGAIENYEDLVISYKSILLEVNNVNNEITKKTRQSNEISGINSYCNDVSPSTYYGSDGSTKYSTSDSGKIDVTGG